MPTSPFAGSACPSCSRQPGTGTVAPKRRLRRLAGLAVAFTLAVVPASVAVRINHDHE